MDGGFPMATPPGLTPEAVPAIFRDRLARLDQDWPSVSDYARFFVEQTAPLLDPADPLLLDYLAHDLAGHRVRLNADALIEDATDIFFGPSKWQQLDGADQAPHRGVEYRRGQPAARTRRGHRALSAQGLDPLVTVQTGGGCRSRRVDHEPGGRPGDGRPDRRGAGS